MNREFKVVNVAVLKRETSLNRSGTSRHTMCRYTNRDDWDKDKHEASSSSVAATGQRCSVSSSSRQRVGLKNQSLVENSQGRSRGKNKEVVNKAGADLESGN